MSRDLTLLPDERLPVQVGQEIAAADWQQLQNSLDTAVGLIFAALGGTNFILGNGNGLTVGPSSGMTVTVGGSGGEHVVTQGRICDVCPVQNITLNAPSGSAGNRLDAIYIQAINPRPAGTNVVTRNVRSASQIGSTSVISATLLNGFVALNFSATYTVAPAVFPQPIGGDSNMPQINVTAITTTSCTITSTDPNDNRTLNVLVVGNPVNSSGIPTAINTLEATAAYLYVPGTPTTGTPVVSAAPDSTWELFATIYVHETEAAVLQSDITYIFPIIAPPIQNFACKTVTASGGISAQTLSCPSGEALVGSLSSNSTGFFDTLLQCGSFTAATSATVEGQLTGGNLTVVGHATVGTYLNAASSTITGAIACGSISAASTVEAVGEMTCGTLSVASTGSAAASIGGTLGAGAVNVTNNTQTGSLGVSGAATVVGALTSGTLSVASSSTSAATINGTLTAGNVVVINDATIEENANIYGNATVSGQVTAASVNLNEGELHCGLIECVAGGSGSGDGVFGGTLTTNYLAVNVGGVNPASYQRITLPASTATTTVTATITIGPGVYNLIASYSINSTVEGEIRLSGSATDGVSWEQETPNYQHSPMHGASYFGGPAGAQGPVAVVYLLGTITVAPNATATPSVTLSVLQTTAPTAGSQQSHIFSIVASR